MNNPTPRDSAQLPSSLMQHALEALEYHQEQTRPIDKTTVAITALREALRAQAASVEPVAWSAAWGRARQQACEAVEGHRDYMMDARRESTIEAGVRAAFEDLWHVLQKSYAGAQPAHIPAVEARAAWFALAMNAASYIEDAAACLRDEEAKAAATRAAKYVREKCNAMWFAAPQPQAVAASSPATAVDAVRVTALKRAAEDAVNAMNPRHGPFIDAVANPLLIIELCEALQASRQSVTQQAVAEGAGDGLTGEDLHRAYFEAKGGDTNRWFDLDDSTKEAWDAAAALAAKELRS